MQRPWLLALALGASAACAGFLAGDPDPRLAAWKAQASALRGLAFEAPVRLSWVSEAALPDVLRGEFDFVFTAESAREYSDAYAALGALPPGIDLIEVMIALQAQAIAGLYSPRSRTLHVIDSLRAPASSGDLGQVSIVVHELVHALQQQHFPETLELLARLRHQDDVVGALSSAIEGDATFSMLGVREGRSGAGGRDEATAARMRDVMLAERTREGGPLENAPPLLRDSLIFPYAHGTPLSARRFAAGGVAGLDAALREPPLSTLRVLAPDDADPVEFVRLPRAELARALASRGCRLGHDNVAGALTLGVLFELHGSASDFEALYRSFSGDRFLQIDCGERWELVWLTRWDSESAALAFAETYDAISAAVARNSRLSGRPEIVLRGRSALVVTPSVHAHAETVLSASEIRAYAGFADWRRDGCFPETPCPVSDASWLFSGSARP